MFKLKKRGSLQIHEGKNQRREKCRITIDGNETNWWIIYADFVLLHHEWKKIYMTEYLYTSYVSTEMYKILAQEQVIEIA